MSESDLLGGSNRDAGQKRDHEDDVDGDSDGDSNRDSDREAYESYGGGGPPTWKVSAHKTLGARVFAEYTNGQAYWGNIVGIRGSSATGNNVKYKILFEDGDTLDNLTSEYLITEKTFLANYSGENPPYPNPDRKLLREHLEEARKAADAAPRDPISASAGTPVAKRQKVESSPFHEAADKRRSAVRGPDASSKRQKVESSPFDEAADKRGAVREPDVSSNMNLPPPSRDEKKKAAPPPMLPPPVAAAAAAAASSSAANACIDLTGSPSPPPPLPPAIQENRANWYTGRLTDGWSPSKLHQERCKTCTLCTKKPCGLCASCLWNHLRKRESPEEVCFHKMCCNILPEKKAQPAVGFPPGFIFYFQENHEQPYAQGVGSEQSSISGLHIVAPDGRTFLGPGPAALRFPAKITNVEATVQQFRSHIGLSYYHIDPHHFLVGRGYCLEWTDVRGRSNVIFGSVSHCSKTGDQGLPKFLIEYSKESRNLLNGMSNSAFGRPIPPTQEIDGDAAWGGCVSFERKMKVNRGPGSVVSNLDRTLPCRCVVVPDMRREELVDYNGIKVPQLTLIVRGYKLVFSVKTSSIPNAGYGVFVKCTSFRKRAVNFGGEDGGVGPESFRLAAGELLDLGIYAPFVPEDTKHENVNNCKTYCFSMKTEMYTFACPVDNYVYDISDDKTGEPHETARQHIPMYFNETTTDAETIHADHDPEGCVHYMMGIKYKGDWEAFTKESAKFDLKADGSEIELFVNYGSLYEHVRIREGYSNLPASQQEKVLASYAEHEAGFVKDIDIYDANEVAMCVDFFLNRCMPEGYYGEGGQGRHIDGELRDRALKMARKFRIRAEKLMKSVKESQSIDISPGVPRFDESEGIDLAKTIQNTDLLIERLSCLSCHRELKASTRVMEEEEDAEVQVRVNEEQMDASNPDFVGGDILDDGDRSDSDSSYDASQDF